MVNGHPDILIRGSQRRGMRIEDAQHRVKGRRRYGQNGGKSVVPPTVLIKSIDELLLESSGGGEGSDDDPP